MMPFYIRARQQDIPTPTISTAVESDDEDNFITDPENFFDELPQPFRLINKLVHEVIELAWNKISSLQHEREMDARRVRLANYLPSSCVTNFRNVSSVCLTEGDIIFLGLENSLVAINQDTHLEQSSWLPEEEISVDQISCTYFEGSEMFLLTLVDDMGFARLLIYESETFHFICILNELVEGCPKSNATRCIISDDCQFCGVALETNKVSTLDFFKLPIDNWIKEIDAARTEYLKKTESLMTTSASDLSADNIPTGRSLKLAFPIVKFSLILPVLKITEPPTVGGTSGKTAQQMLDQVSSGDVIGDGTCHILTENALYIQKKLFHVLNERDLIYDEEDSVPLMLKPTFHFLRKSCMEPPLQIKSDALFTHVGIWWSNHHNFYIYQLAKSGKNVEFKADSVWPQSSSITCCETAHETMSLSIGLEDGSMTLWDRNLGLVKSVIMICPKSRIKSINFLSCVLGMKYSMLVGCGNGQISHIMCGTDEVKSTIVFPSENKEDKFALIKPLPKLPGIFFMVSQNGSMVLRNSEQDSILCNLTLPEDIQFENPYQTGYALDHLGDVLYLKGSSLSTSNESCIFLFHLRSFPTLDKVRAVQEEEVPETAVKLSSVVESLLIQRMKKQAARTDALADRWYNLDKQLSSILNLKEMVVVASKEHHFSRSSTPSTSETVTYNKSFQKV